MGFLYILSGIIGGIIGGMGMGGGTLLIPLLTILLGVEQHVAQAVNLVVFIPMAIVSLLIHFKNNLIETNKVFYIMLGGIPSCVIGCIVASFVSGEVLKKIFGGFLIILSVFQLITAIRCKSY